MPRTNLREYADNYSKISRSLSQYYRNETALTNTGLFADFTCNSASFKFKQKTLGEAENDGTKAVEIMVQLKYLSNFWRTLEMSLMKS